MYSVTSQAGGLRLMPPAEFHLKPDAPLFPRMTDLSQLVPAQEDDREKEWR